MIDGRTTPPGTLVSFGGRKFEVVGLQPGYAKRRHSGFGMVNCRPVNDEAGYQGWSRFVRGVPERDLELWRDYVERIDRIKDGTANVLTDAGF